MKQICASFLLFIFSLIDGASSTSAVFNVTSQTHLFSASDFIVRGPTVFPKPSDVAGYDAMPLLKPTFGKHRPHEDAVFVFAIDYTLETYLTVVNSLRQTGFGGDVVFSISRSDANTPGVYDFLRDSPGLVTYIIDLVCYDTERESTDLDKKGMRVCQVHNLWGRKQNSEIVPLQDTRDTRMISTLRYELYWIWSLNYIPHVWIMLLDGRDSYFQKNPFAKLERTSQKDANKEDGLLYFFAENVDATRLGLNHVNRAGLKQAYGDLVVKALEEKPTICSGATMGEQVALEAYIRAMVAEADETGTKMLGADQGFHNYLYYTNKLANSKNIQSITVFDHGWGLVNNMGALRTKELHQWANGRILQKNDDGSMIVLNWDGQPAAVVHQFDKHQDLATFIQQTKTEEYKSKYFGELDKRQKARAAADEAAAALAAQQMDTTSGGQTGTEGQGDTVVEGQGDTVVEGQADNVAEGQADNVAEE